jgi:hypothetical protein
MILIKTYNQVLNISGIMFIINKNTRFTIFSRYTRNLKIPVQSKLLASFTSMNNIS